MLSANRGREAVQAPHPLRLDYPSLGLLYLDRAALVLRRTGDRITVAGGQQVRKALVEMEREEDAPGLRALGDARLPLYLPAPRRRVNEPLL